MASVYLASPLGFSQSTLEFMKLLEQTLEGCGLAVVNPWHLVDDGWFSEAAATTDCERRRQAYHKVNTKIASANERAVRSSDFVVAVLDGVDVDSGTASEIGFAYALGKVIFGYRSDSRRAGDNDGAMVNLQVQYWVEASGGSVVTSLGDLRSAILARNPAKRDT